jgi:hypothetical protein
MNTQHQDENSDEATRTAIFQSGIRHGTRGKIPGRNRKQTERVQLKWRFALWKTVLGQTPNLGHSPLGQRYEATEEEAA